MYHNLVARSVGASLVVICLASTTQAQVTIDASKITCEQFAHSKIAPVRTAAVWLNGYYHGKRDNPIVDQQAFEANADKLERFCSQEKNYRLPVMQAIEQVLGKG